ncbi:hypothetical protein EVAR_50833_1 [Eumeta japonica]|uniref:Uncharacterized protein n=1 Tax=Eumeta variegata TaxID=151549 RepID=A0A4C1XBS5_EUMVA|nr:hypothetical protein EVAR_50833_1 [Eumeta japonica]
MSSSITIKIMKLLNSEQDRPKFSKYHLIVIACSKNYHYMAPVLRVGSRIKVALSRSPSRSPVVMYMSMIDGKQQQVWACTGMLSDDLASA